MEISWSPRTDQLPPITKHRVTNSIERKQLTSLWVAELRALMQYVALARLYTLSLHVQVLFLC